MSISNTEHQRRRAELAGLIFEATLLRTALIERKAGYNPDQPRESTTGRWTDGPAAFVGAMTGGMRRAFDHLPPEVRKPLSDAAASAQKTLDDVGKAVMAPIDMATDAVESAIEHAPPPVKAFLDKNRAAINRTLGGLQMAAGAGEVMGGGAAIADSGGAAAAAGAWMVAHGADDWDTGLKMLVSGEAQDSNLSQALRGFGISAKAAEGMVVMTSGLAPSVAARLPQAAVEAAADQALEREALISVATKGVVVTKDGSSIWDIKNITARGEAWEAYNNAGSSLIRTPPGFKTFDQMSADQSVVVSNKTLDLERDFYLDPSRSRVQSKIKGFVDAAADFGKDARSGVVLSKSQIQDRSVNLLIPAGRPIPGQVTQLEAASLYARSRNVRLNIFYGQ